MTSHAEGHLPHEMLYDQNECINSMLQDMARLESVLSDLTFIEAKFECGQGYDYWKELLQATSQENASKLLKDLSKVM